MDSTCPYLGYYTLFGFVLLKKDFRLVLNFQRGRLFPRLYTVLSNQLDLDSATGEFLVRCFYRSARIEYSAMIPDVPDMPDSSLTLVSQ